MGGYSGGSSNIISSPAFVGPAFFAETVGGATAEFRVGNLTAPVECHTEGGGAAGYSGFGARNDLLQNGSGTTRAGATLVAYGSAAANTFFGIPAANGALLASAGADGTGLIIGSGTSGKPISIGTFNQDGAQELKGYFRGNYKLLSDNVDTGIMRIAIALNTFLAGKLDWTVYCIAAGAMQIRSGTCWYNAFNRGTETSQVSNAVNLANLESGTLAVTFSLVDSGTNQMDLKVLADTSLTPIILAIQYTLWPIAGAGVYAEL